MRPQRHTTVAHPYCFCHCYGGDLICPKHPPANALVPKVHKIRKRHGRQATQVSWLKASLPTSWLKACWHVESSNWWSSQCVGHLAGLISGVYRNLYSMWMTAVPGNLPGHCQRAEMLQVRYTAGTSEVLRHQTELSIHVRWMVTQLAQCDGL